MQARFRPDHGVTDGPFAVMMGSKKHQEIGLGSYGEYVDLVKAFDTVNRKALCELLKKSGMPGHFVNTLYG